MAGKFITTDSVVPGGNHIVNVLTTITWISGPVENHAPTQLIGAKKGFTSLTQNNNGGRYGWIAFGQKVGSVYYFHERQQITYFHQMFEPPNEKCSCVRLWLKNDVGCDLLVTPLWDGWKTVEKVVNALMPVLVKRVTPQILLPGKKNLPAVVP